MIFTIAFRELRNMFISPLAWIVLAISQLILAWTFLKFIEKYFKDQPKLMTLLNAPGVTDLVIAPLFFWASIVLLMVIPILTMRLISEEKRNKTLVLLMSSPISMTEIVLGKFIGIVLFLMIFILMVTLMPLSLLSGAEIDLWKLASGMIGLIFISSAFAAAGLFMSSLTSNPTIAAISTFGLLLLLWIIDSGSGANATSGNVFNYISMIKHFYPMLRGVMSNVDIFYYILFIVFFLILSIKQLDTQRIQS